MVWYSHLFRNFPLCCGPHKGFSIVSEAEVDVFLEFPCFLHDPMDVGNLISGSSASLKTRVGNAEKGPTIHALTSPPGNGSAAAAAAPEL